MIAIDFDETLNFSKKGKGDFVPNYDLIEILKNKEFSVLTARSESDENKEYVSSFLKKYFPEKYSDNLDGINIFYTNGEPKGSYLKDNGFSVLVDDKDYQISSAKEFGKDGFKPEDFIEKESIKIKKAERRLGITKVYRKFKFKN